MLLLQSLVLLLIASASHGEWRCPELSARPAAECSCDLPHTLRCAGDSSALQKIGRHLREQRVKNKSTSVSLLDCSLRNVSALSAASVGELAGIGLHGLVISSGEIRRVQQGAFNSVATTLLALGLPNNQLPSVPTESISHLYKLDRLDLSNNKIHTLDISAFKGLQNLTYLDLSDNQLTDIASEAFKPLVKLSVLRLRGNFIKVTSLSALKNAQSLQVLDLSSNALEGPLNYNTIPALRHLATLHLAYNTFASIRRGALAGLTNLTTLNLHNNEIDVLEDYSFKHLTNLSELDLSHNEIVAVSGASLARLTNLVKLDLSHNYLRSLSAEPLKSLSKLTDLLLHDNDISMIDDGALTDHKDLKRFTIEDNPLNCDCLMASFARWLREAKFLSQIDKTTAVCATPPHLEGAIISRISKNKFCDDFDLIHSNKAALINLKKEDEVEFNTVLANGKEDSRDEERINDLSRNSDPVNYIDGDKNDGLNDDIYDEEFDVPTDDDLPVSTAKVILQDAWYEDQEVHLNWSIDPPSPHRFRCTGVTVAQGTNIPKHVACHRAVPSNVVIRGLKIDPAEVYTFCIALEEMDTKDTPLSLVLGCSVPHVVRQRVKFATPMIAMDLPIVTLPVVAQNHDLRVSEVRSNVTSEGILTVLVSLLGLPRPSFRTQRLTSEIRFSPSIPNCYVVVAVLSGGSLVAQKDTPCKSSLEISMEGFIRGPYEVCATISKFKQDDMTPICVVPQFMDTTGSLEIKSPFRNLNTALVGVSLGLMVLVVGLVWFVRKMLKKPTNFDNHRCFRTEPAVEENARASYTMLTATSKV